MAAEAFVAVKARMPTAPATALTRYFFMVFFSFFCRAARTFRAPICFSRLPISHTAAIIFVCVWIASIALVGWLAYRYFWR